MRMDGEKLKQRSCTEADGMPLREYERRDMWVALTWGAVTMLAALLVALACLPEPL